MRHGHMIIRFFCTPREKLWRWEKVGGKKNKLFSELGAGVWVKLCKRKNLFIEHHISRNIHTTSKHVQTLVALMETTIPYVHTLLRAKLKFVTIVWT